MEGAFPTNIIASPLAYGNAELIKTTITFKYENYFIDRTSRQPNGYLNISDTGRDIRGIPFTRPAEQAPQPGFEVDKTAVVVEETSEKKIPWHQNLPNVGFGIMPPGNAI